MQEILRNRPFISLWWTGVLIQVATWILHTSMLVLVFERTNSPFATGLIPVFASLPLIILGPIAGHIVDRWDRRFVMVCGVLILAVLMIVSIPAATGGTASFLFVFIFLQAIVMTVLTPAENALLPLLMPTKHLKLANALNALNDGLGRIIGHAVGTIILVRYGVAGVFGVSLPVPPRLCTAHDLEDLVRNSAVVEGGRCRLATGSRMEGRVSGTGRPSA